MFKKSLQEVCFPEMEEIIKKRVLIEDEEHYLRKKYQKTILKFLKITHPKLSSISSCLMERQLIVEKPGEKTLIECEQQLEEYIINTDLNKLVKRNSEMIREKIYSILYALQPNFENKKMSKVLLILNDFIVTNALF